MPEVVFSFDGDRAGRAAAWRALENALPVLHEGRQISFLFLPDGEDPDSLVRKEGAEAFGTRLKSALSLPDYFFQQLAEQVDLNRLDGRARLVDLARPHLAKLRPGVLHQLMLVRLAELSRLPEAQLNPLLAGGRPVSSGVARRTFSRSSAPGGQRPSLVRTAIALLLQNPGLSQLATNIDELRGLEERPGIGLFLDLLNLLKERADLKTGSIIEHYRDSEHQPALAKLAAWEHPEHSGDVTAEFRGVLEQLRREARHALAERLMNKEQLSGLSLEEKTELRRLLKEKNPGPSV